MAGSATPHLKEIRAWYLAVPPRPGEATSACYHAFKRRETLDLSKVGRSLLQGRGEAPQTIESEGQMLERACGALMALKNVVVINDEAHHCYREKPDSDEEGALKGEEKDEAKKNNEAARLWISGIEALKRKVGARGVYDLSATPFFLRGSGYLEGTLFPWVVSDFSLMDANRVRHRQAAARARGRQPTGRRHADLPQALGPHRQGDAEEGRRQERHAGPAEIPSELQTALWALYGHYKETYELWKRNGIAVPPVFIVVCNNTATSKLVYEWISGWDRPNEDGDLVNVHQGHLELFRNYDQYGQRLARPNTLFIDSDRRGARSAIPGDRRPRDRAVQAGEDASSSAKPTSSAPRTPIRA